MTNKDEGSMATRASLLERLKDWGQQTAWGKFAQDYRPLICNVARKAGLNDHEADEVAQEVLIAVAKNIGQFQHAGNRGSFRAWLYQQARWRVADQFRARERESRKSQEPDLSQPAGKFPSLADEPHPPESDVLGESHPALGPEMDPCFQQLWDREWADHVYRAAVVRVKSLVSARQFQLFDLHVIQGLSVGESARASGASLASVYMAKSRVGRLLRRQIQTVSDLELGS